MLIQTALQGTADQSTAAMVDRSSQQLGAAAVAVGQSAGKVDEILTWVRGLGGLGN
ncbi:hypothetical protein ACLQ3H_16655 [Micromonospora saelicesensis]|uniref:hypothetical protein n=1 Tax=Micromonospora saelicesensis TaxID=285676 RepID=UPI003CEDB4A3